MIGAFLEFRLIQRVEDFKYLTMPQINLYIRRVKKINEERKRAIEMSKGQAKNRRVYARSKRK